MKVRSLILLASLLIASVTIANASILRGEEWREYYAVGGELIPLSMSSFIISPLLILILAIGIFAAGAVLLSGRVNIELVTE